MKQRDSDFGMVGLPTVEQPNFRRGTTVLTQYIRDAHKSQSVGKGHGRLLYRGGLTRPRGFHDFNNLQWDPRIYRGRTSQDFRDKNLTPITITTTINSYKYCCTGSNQCAQPPARSRKGQNKKIMLPTRYKIGGIIRPTDNDVLIEDASGNPCYAFDKTIIEMEPFIIEETETAEHNDVETQMDATKEAPPKRFHPVACGTSKSSQANISTVGSGSLDDPLEPFIVNIREKVVQEGLLETTQELELHQIHSEIAKHVEIRRLRQYQESKMLQREQFKAETAEKERIIRERQLEHEEAAENLIAARVFSVVTCSHLLVQTLVSLRRDKLLFMVSNHMDEFRSWVNEQVRRANSIPSRLVDEFIRNAEGRRTTAVAYEGPTSTPLSIPLSAFSDVTSPGGTATTEDYNFTVGETELEFEPEQPRRSTRGVRFSENIQEQR